MARKTNLTGYESKAVRQLLNGNPKIAKMLPTSTNDEIIEYIRANYQVTQEQLDYFVRNI